MNCRNKHTVAALLVFVLCLLCAGGAATMLVHAEEPAYYVCFSSQNYAVRNANKMTPAEDGTYLLENVNLNGTVDFYITDNAGKRWYASDNRPLSVEESGAFDYDICFSPAAVFTETEGWAATDCNISYRFHVPAAYSVFIGETETQLTYNPYHSAYELYYLSSVYLSAGSEVSYESETHTIGADGYYRILFTPPKTTDGKTYLFDENGHYGTGDDYIYSLFIEDAVQYYAVFRDGIGIAGDETVDERDAYLLKRYEDNVLLAEYRSAVFFLPDCDSEVRYALYEKSADGRFRPVDVDGDDKTKWSKVTATDPGWYCLAVSVAGSIYADTLEAQDTPFGAWYLAADFNGYGFDEEGQPDLHSSFVFAEVQEGAEDYSEEYEQYLLYLTVTEKDLKAGDISFYITDGKTSYKNGSSYITLNTPGTYKILFSEEHTYGRDRHYRYILQDDLQAYTEITLTTAEEFLAFAQNCTQSADYSVRLAVYLAADIDFAGVEFVPVGSFSGHFYGGYHTLRNITIADGGEQTAVFSAVTRTGVVERLNVENLCLGESDSQYVGFVGRNYGTVQYVTTSGWLMGDSYVGGVVAYNGKSRVDDQSATVDSDLLTVKGTVKDCESRATVSGERFVGGVVGFNSGEMTACRSCGRVSGRKTNASATVVNVGGVVGYSSGRVTNCNNESRVSGGDDSLYVGGIVGLCTGEVYFSFNHADVSASRYAGGICGYYGKVENDSDDLNEYFGGMAYSEFLAGFFDGSDEDFEQAEGERHLIDYCANDGNITAFAYVGGIVAYSRTTGLSVRNCASTGELSATAGSYVGGIAGYCVGADINGCMTAGMMQAKGLREGQYVGGIVGYGDKVSCCMSAATLKGADYLGGIAGYAEGNIRACYTNTWLLPDTGAGYVGEIAGFAAAYQPSTDRFPEDFAGNYHTGTLGGIGGKDYAGAYGYAAAFVESEKLSSDGMLSPWLCEAFDRAFWQGGDGTVCYPMLTYFEEAEACAAFDDEEGWQNIYDKHASRFAALMQDAARRTYTVTFMEWNKDNGALYDDDGVLQTDRFDVISIVRVYAGQSPEAPTLRYAEPNGQGGYLYRGKTARYYVAFPTVVAEGNMAVYAAYTEIVTSLHSEDGAVIAEGDFPMGTTLHLLSVGDCHTVQLLFEGQELPVQNITVKFRVGADADGYTVFRINGADECAVESEVSGAYLSFAFSGGDYFRIAPRPQKHLPTWAWFLIGAGTAIAAGGVAVACVAVVRRKKQK